MFHLFGQASMLIGIALVDRALVGDPLLPLEFGSTVAGEGGMMKSGTVFGEFEEAEGIISAATIARSCSVCCCRIGCRGGVCCNSVGGEGFDRE